MQLWVVGNPQTGKAECQVLDSVGLVMDAMDNVACLGRLQYICGLFEEIIICQ